MPHRISHRAQGWLIAAVILAAALVLGAVAAIGTRGDGGTPPQEPEQASYIEALAGTWQRVNPLLLTGNPVDADLAALIFSSLVQVGPGGTVEPGLADLPDITSDGLTYRFVLRDDATWHDGEPVTSEDVATTIRLIQSADFPGPAAMVEAWADVGVATPDRRTVVFTLPESSAPFLARSVATTGIVAAHLFEDTSGAALAASPLNTNPIGTGPYRLDSLDASQATLTAHEGYHLGPPALASVQFRFVSDETAAIEMLLAGDADSHFFRGWPPEGRVNELVETGRLASQTFGGSAYLALYLNNDQTAYFDEPAVRRAINLAIDREALVELVPGGHAVASNSAVPPGTWAYDAQLDGGAAPPDLNQARTLLAEAGWALAPGSGVLTREGNEFRFSLHVDDDPVRAEIAAAIANQLEPLGIRATVVATTTTALQRDFLQTRRYDAAIAGWEQGADPDGYAAWHSSQVGSAGLNIANFRSVVIDEILTAARTATDPAVRLDFYRQFQEVWADRTPSPVLLYPQYTAVYPEDLDGVYDGVLFDPTQRFFNVHLWQR